MSIKLRILFIGMFLLAVETTMAQVSVIGGANYCTVRNNDLIQNQDPIYAHHFGVMVRYHPFRKLPNLSIQNELIYTRKGYQQELDKTYLFHFNYLSLPVLLNYAPAKYFSVHTGVELSGLFNTNLEKGNLTYNNVDLGIVGGFSFFDNARVSLYTRYTHGLVPMLKYYTFDKLGNFTDNIRDFRNSCLSVGLKINIYNERIETY